MQSAYSKFKIFNLFLHKKFASHLRQKLFIHFQNYFKQINIKQAINRFNNNNNKNNSKTGSLVSLAACSVFAWDEHRITNNEIKREINEILKVFDDKHNKTDVAKENFNRINFEASRKFEDKEWNKIFDKEDLIIWRRKIGVEPESGSDIYEHKVLGRIHDITPIEYYQTQLDLEYRKEWDFLVILLEVLQKDPVSKSELVRWVSKFPYPLSAREYVFVRRSCIEPNEKLLVLLSRGLPDFSNIKFADSHKNVKVTQYKSNMIIIPYTDFNEPGIYYVIQYYDVTKAKIPKLAMKWAATSGLPDYVSKLHKATLKQRKSVNNIKEVDINSFELFDMNDQSQTDSGSSYNESESEINLYEKADEYVNDNGVEAVVYHDEVIDEVIPEFLIEITKKLNEDYFNEYEPHPIFTNYF